MRSRFVYQMIPTLVAGDAVSHQALLMDEIFRRWGLRSAIAAENYAGVFSARVSPPRFLPNVFSDEDLVVYHHSTGSDLARAFSLARGARRILVYHNITPPELLAHAPDLAARAHLGRRQLAASIHAADVILADSRYNMQEVTGGASGMCLVAPLVLDDRRRRLLQDAAASRHASSQPTWLFVGRIVPHKRIEVLIRALRIYREQHDPKARLLVVGGDNEAPEYASKLRQTAMEECGDSVEFRGKLIGDALQMAFEEATLFVTASAHEGFCVPLVESMVARLPIIAIEAGAVAETLGATGVLLDNADPAMIAEAAQIIHSDPALRTRLIEAQLCRANEFTASHLEEILRHVVD